MYLSQLRRASKKFIYKGYTQQEIVDILNKDYPISLVDAEILIDRVHQRHPSLTKSDVSLVILYFFIILRDQLVLNKIIIMKEMIKKMYLIVAISGKRIYPRIKLQTITELKIKS